jgi:RNA polymerase sigma-70 factor (ECF subfamily)
MAPVLFFQHRELYSFYMQPLSDEQLIAVSNDPGETPVRKQMATDELFGRYQTRVALWCFRVSRDREWAADLAQEVFLRAFRNLSTFRGDSKFSTWLYTIARNHCFNAIQAKVTRAEDSLDFLQMPDSSGRSVDRELEKEDQLQHMRDLINQTLDDTERQVMTLHYGEEMTLDSVTRMLNLRNASGAKAYIVSARRKLQSAIGRGSATNFRPGGKR